jgi:two-component system, OmpR family, KDP operon response regulator KdpE
MNTNKEKILVVDDDVQIRRALRNALSARGYEVLLASGGEEALEIAALEIPSMVILDLSMPGMSGLEVCRELRTWSQLPILVLSVYDKEADKVAALDLGADDYLTKPFNTGELLARIRAHIRRAKQLPSTVTVFESGGLKVDLARHYVLKNDQEVKLTKTEYSLLQYLIQNSGRVVTYSILISKVWGPEYDGDTQTLRVHIGNLRKKIEEDPNRPLFILTEPGVGYRFNANNE